MSKNFNPRSLAGATKHSTRNHTTIDISIHAPLRERQTLYKRDLQLFIFQSTLPCGSDRVSPRGSSCAGNFNPRSLAGATAVDKSKVGDCGISIHAPSRERLISDLDRFVIMNISIHAPSRERPFASHLRNNRGRISIHAPSRERLLSYLWPLPWLYISIHAPSRERLIQTTA